MGDENQFLAAKRVLQKTLKINENLVNLDNQNVQIIEEIEDSPSFPGLRTLYRKRIISVEFNIEADGYAQASIALFGAHSQSSPGTPGTPSQPPKMCNMMSATMSHVSFTVGAAQKGTPRNTTNGLSTMRSGYQAMVDYNP